MCGRFGSAPKGTSVKPRMSNMMVSRPVPNSFFFLFQLFAVFFLSPFLFFFFLIYFFLSFTLSPIKVFFHLFELLVFLFSFSFLLYDFFLDEV